MRRKTREVAIGRVRIGGDNAIAVQSMTTTQTSDVEATVGQLSALEKAGCDIARLALNSTEDCRAVPALKEAVKMPLVADIQFDYRLALKAMENGIDKVRFNPGNIGDPKNIETLVSCAKEMHVPIRIGVNSGSLEKGILEKYGNTATALVESALKEVALLEKLGYGDIVLSVKSSSVPKMVEAYRLLSGRVDYPLHLGVTEAGTWEDSIVKSSAGIGSLLLDGIGDTIRVSVTGDPLQEIPAARSILRAVGLDKNYCEVVSCPTCSRCTLDLSAIVTAVKDRYKDVKTPLKLAVMGCAVNGPGEARDADFGLAGGAGRGILFSKGSLVRQVDSAELLTEFFKLVDGHLKNITVKA